MRRSAHPTCSPGPRHSARPRAGSQQSHEGTAGPPAAHETTASPTSMRTTKPTQPSNRTSSSSYFGPVADQIVIDAGQFDGFGIVASQPFRQALDRRVEIEDH